MYIQLIKYILRDIKHADYAENKVTFIGCGFHFIKWARKHKPERKDTFQ